MNINIDTHQIFPNYNINKITSDICLSDNPKTGIFLKDNKHLIDIVKLNINKNDWSINFLLENKMKILSTNRHDKALDYLIKNEDKINIYDLIKNTNDKAVEYILNKYTDITKKIKMLKLNTNDKAVEFIIKNIELADSQDKYEFLYNPNKKAKEFIKNNREYFIGGGHD